MEPCFRDQEEKHDARDLLELEQLPLRVYRCLWPSAAAGCHYFTRSTSCVFRGQGLSGGELRVGTCCSSVRAWKGGVLCLFAMKGFHPCCDHTVLSLLLDQGNAFRCFKVMANVSGPTMNGR